MYRNSYQRGMLTIFYSGGAKPLNLWDTQVKDGVISRFLDPDLRAMVLEIKGTNVSTTYMTCPKGKTVLGISMPFMVMIVKNLKKYFTFEVTILDETGTRRRFRVANFQSQTQIQPLCTVMPIGLSEGWNQIQFNLADFTRRAYQKQFIEVQKVKINANIRLRRVYFAERLVPEEELPPEYKLYFPLTAQGKGRKVAKVQEDKKDVEAIVEQPTSDAVPVEHITTSKLEVGKLTSKASVHSVKKTISQEERKSSKDKLEEISEAEPKSSLVKIPDEAGEVPVENQEQITEEASALTKKESQMERTTAETEGHQKEEAEVHETEKPPDHETEEHESQKQVEESPPDVAVQPAPEQVSSEPEPALVPETAVKTEAPVESEAPQESEVPAPTESNE